MNKFNLSKIGVLEELLKVERVKKKKNRLSKTFLNPLQLEVQRLLNSTII